MSRAEDVVRARAAAAEAAAASGETERIERGIASMMAKIEHAIPRILRGLEARDYPGARLLTVGSVSHGVFRKRWEPIEMAAWLIHVYSGTESHSADYLLSDGRLLSSGSGSQGSGSSTGPYAVRDMSRMWRPEQVLHKLELLWDAGRDARRPERGGVRYRDDNVAGIQGLLNDYGVDI